MLSNEDIIKEIGKGILIHPIDLENIRGNSINLRASNLAWCLNGGKYYIDESSTYAFNKDTQKIHQGNSSDDEVITKKLSNIVHKNSDEKEVIIIPPNDTALIETLETISVNYKIGGTYHSKVGIVTQGVGHIGTTLDPGYTGQSLIAIHNHSNKAIIINVEDTFVTVIFDYLKSRATYDSNNFHGHIELLTQIGIKLTAKEKELLGKEWKKSNKTLKNKMIESDVYKKFKNSLKVIYKQEKNKMIRQKIYTFITMILILGILIGLAYSLDKYLLKNTTLLITKWILTVGLSGVAVVILQWLFVAISDEFERRLG